MATRGHGSRGRGSSRGRSGGSGRGRSVARSDSSTGLWASNSAPTVQVNLLVFSSCLLWRSLKKSTQYSLQGTSAVSSALLRASTKQDAVGFSSPQHMERFLNAAITECAVDPTFVLDCLGSADKGGLRRLKEVCSTPFATQVRCIQHAHNDCMPAHLQH